MRKFEFAVEKKSPLHVALEISDNAKWLIYMYHNILKMKDVDENDSGHRYWMKELDNGVRRDDIEKYFREVAAEEGVAKPVSFSDFLGKDDEGKRMIMVMPQSAGDVFCCTSLFKSIKDTYPEYNLYFATKKEYMDLLEDNPYLYKCLEYQPFMENLLYLEGAGSHKGFFEIAFLPHVGTQRVFNYQHNGKDKVILDILDESYHC